MSRDLDKFDMILAFFCGEMNRKEWAKQFVRSRELKRTSKKILILSDTEFSYTDSSNYIYRKIGRDEAKEIENLYRMYEFSDRIIMLSESPQYGGLVNYVKTGVMTMEEVIRSFF